nr:flagellar hook-length control protein FliK [uncultured Desulfuromonas sp.]
MQTLPIATQAVASKSTSTRTVKSASDTRDFLPTLNKAEAKTTPRTERSETSRSTTGTASRDDSRQETRTQRQSEARQARQDSDATDASQESSASETAAQQETAQATDETVTSEEGSDKDTPDTVVVATDAEVLPTEEPPAVDESHDELLVAEAAIDGDSLAETPGNMPVGPRIHEEQRQGMDRAAEAKAAQAAQRTPDATGSDDLASELLDDAQLAQKIKEQLTQPASIKAESVQVAAQTMDQLKNSGQVQVEEVNGVAGLNSEGEESSGKITDPRFASLLNRQDVETVLRQRQTPAQVATNANGLAANGGEKLAENLLNAATGGTEDGAELTTAKPNTAVESLMQRAAGDTVSHDAHAALTHTAHQQTSSTTTSTFALGQRHPVNVPDSHIVNQTVEHLSIHARGESSSVTVRLHPEELGELQLRMVMEGDQLKVHLHAQSQQVQEVLERNFPRLRDALQDQGMTVEDFQVSVDSGDAQQQQSSGEQGHASGRGSVAVTMDADMMAQVAEVVPGAAIDSSQGISVRI